MRRRLPLVLAGLLALTVAVVAVLAGATLVRREPDRPRTVAVAAQPAGSHALRVLHGWDRRRAQAWSDGSVRRLRLLYARGSEAGAADRAMLAAYRARGLRVTDMRRQTFAVREVHASGRTLTLRVTDRLVSAVAVGEGMRQPLPGQGFESQTLTFRRSPRGWIRVG
jgi:hypothetical protein